MQIIKNTPRFINGRFIGTGQMSKVKCQRSRSASQTSNVKCQKSRRVNRARGSLLIEILIVVSILAVVLSLGAQSSYVSLVANKSAGEKDVAMGIATETLEAVRGASDEKWQNLYDLTKGSANHHYPSQSSGKWVISNNGDETVALNDATYTRYFIVDNVSRDPSSRGIETTYNSANDDPSTQKITVTVSWLNNDSVTISEYLSRWRNKVCPQVSWAGGAVPGGSVACTGGTTYDNSTNLGTPGTSLQIQ